MSFMHMISAWEEIFRSYVYVVIAKVNDMDKSYKNYLPI